MPYIEVNCSKCGGTQKITCSCGPCSGKGGWQETYAGETKWVPCPYCTGQGTPGTIRCDNGCVWGKIKVWQD